MNIFKKVWKSISGVFKPKKNPEPLPSPEPIPIPTEPTPTPVDPEPVQPEPTPPEPAEPSNDDNPDDDNEDPEKPDDGGDYTVYLEDTETLYYPKAIRSKHKLRTRGSYSKKYPLGAIVHFTAGRGRNKEEGGVKNAETHQEMGERSIAYADEKGSYAYFIIDRSGNVHQNFPLNRWGYHAGTSAWKGLSGSVSDELVGIEIQVAGRLSDYYQNSSEGSKHDCPEGKLAAWYTRPNSGDLFFDKETECRYSENNDNIQKGWYHKYSPEQEEALEELLIWMKRNNPDVFEFKYVLGHDEVAGMKGIGRNRKNDPGAALSMTMTEYRDKLTKEYKNRYDGLVPSEPLKDIIQEGDTGEKVNKLQTKLTQLGYSLGTVDGVFGPKTEKAVKQFQKDNDLSQTGSVDEQTWEFISKAGAINTKYCFRWGNTSWDNYLVTALKSSTLLSVIPEDKSNFGDNVDPILFWGNILVEMAKWESNWKPESEYKESFGVWSRGLYQLSLSDKNNYKGITFTSEEDVHDPKKNIEAAVIILDKLVSTNKRIAGKVEDKWQGGARYWSVLRGSRDYTLKALNAIKKANS